MDREAAAVIILFFVLCSAFMAVDLSLETTAYQCTNGDEVVYFSNRKPHKALNYGNCTETKMTKSEYFDAKNSFRLGSRN